MMFFELQLSASLFTHIVRNRIKAVPLCVDRDFNDRDGTQLVIDRIEIGDSTWLQREKKIDIVSGALPQSHDAATQVVWIFSPTNYTSVTVPFLQVKQEALVHLVKLSDLELNGPNPSPVHRTLTIYPVFNVELSAANQTQGGGPLTLSYTLAYVDPGALALGLSDAQRVEIEQFVAGVRLDPTRLDLSQLTDQLKRPVSAINAGIACDPAGSFIALRVDFDVYTTPPHLSREFFEAGPTDRLGDREWAMLIDADVLKDGASQLVRNGLQGTPKVRLNSGPAAAWDPNGPAIDINADIELIDACPFFVENIDMDAHVTIRSTLWVPTPNTLGTYHHLKGEPSDIGEEMACALTAALLWPFIGVILVQDDNTGLDPSLRLPAYLGGLLLGPYILFVGIIAAIETHGVSRDLSHHLGSTCVKRDNENYECNDPLNIVLQLSPPFNSRLDLEAVSGVPEGAVLSGTVSNLGDTPGGNLESIDVKPFAWQVQGRCTGKGTDNFRVGNEASISLGFTPPADMCSARIVADQWGEFSMVKDDLANSITITPNFTAMYLANPYPCQVRLSTTRGVRIITLQPPARLGNDEAVKLEEARIRAVASCYVWEVPHTPIDELHWIPDPPFTLTHSLQLWQIVTRGMQAGEIIRVQGPDRKTVLTAHPSLQGVTHMTMLFEGESAPSQLSFQMLGRHDDSRREISMQQVLYARQATVPVRGPLSAMRFEGGAQDRRLVIIDEAQEMMWQVSSAFPAPSLLSSIAREIGAHQDGLVVHTGKRIGADQRNSLLRALDGFRERDSDLECVASPRVGGVGETLAVRVGRITTLYDISGPEPAELQVFETPAWFEGTALGGDLLAKHDPAASGVHLYAAVARATR